MHFKPVSKFNIDKPETYSINQRECVISCVLQPDNSTHDWGAGRGLYFFVILIVCTSRIVSEDIFFGINIKTSKIGFRLY